MGSQSNILTETVESLDLSPKSVAVGTVHLPGSKSISNRVLLLSALAEGVTEVRDVLASDDTDRMLDALSGLGVKLEQSSATCYQIRGVDGAFPIKNAELFLGNAGTAFRPLTAVLALSSGHYTLKGVARMHERPIGDLVNALRQLGARIDYLGAEGFPPLAIHPAVIQPNGCVTVRGDVSSQFLTGLLMALPLAQSPVSIEVEGDLISKPYIDITIATMAQFGVTVQREGWRKFAVPKGAKYKSPGTVYVEGDASAASYFLAAGAIGGGPVRVEGVGRHSIQGDVRFVEALAAMGAEIEMGENWIEARAPKDWVQCRTQGRGWLKALDLDCNHIPDAAMTLAVLAMFADGPSTLRNIASWRVKETDRLTAMATELRKLGAVIEESEDALRIVPPSALNFTPHASIVTYDDHRIAMCFSLMSLGGVPIGILDPRCVNKTFPTYFDEFERIVRD